MIVVKLGGSVITDKAAGAPTLRAEALSRLGQELAHEGLKGVVVHGAGSFGHAVAARHGFSTRPSVGTDAGAREVRASVRALDAHVVAALTQAGVPAQALDPTTVVRVRRGRLEGMDKAALKRAIEAGRVPVLFGDLVPDLDHGWSVVSGDDMAIMAARELRATRLLFATDVDGLFTGPPSDPGARLVERLDDDVDVRYGGAATDVTGGLARKVRLLKEAAGPGLTVGIVNGLVPGRLGDALRGRPLGTWLLPPAGSQARP